MITDNIRDFIEFLRNKGLEREWRCMITISDFSHTVSVDFGDLNDNLVGCVTATYDEINEAKTPTYLASNLFNWMVEVVK